MGFQLHVLDMENGWTVEVVLTEPDRELVTRQMARCMDCGGLEFFARWLSGALATSLPGLVDYDLRPPSEPQVTYATAMARTLGILLTPDVLRYRGAMHEFLSSHKDAFDALRRARSGGTPVTAARSESLGDRIE